MEGRVLIKRFRSLDFLSDDARERVLDRELHEDGWRHCVYAAGGAGRVLGLEGGGREVGA